MTLRTSDYALLSQQSYNDPEVISTGTDGPIYKKVVLDGVSYLPIAHVDNPHNGFQATAYERADTHEVVIAYRGTEFGREARQDGVTDARMAVDGVNAQSSDAEAFTRKVIDTAKHHADARHDVPHVTVTGHSLGGTLAETMAFKYHLHGETFNAFGAAGISGIPHGGNQVINYVRATDVVSAASAHFGEVRVYATQQDIDALHRSGYHDNGLLNVVTPHLPILGGIQGDAHAIDNFVPRSTLLGHSIVSPENLKRAQVHHGLIATYRNDIATDRDVAFAVYQTHKPLIAGAKLALEAGHYVEQKTEQAYDVTRTTLIVGAAAAGHLAQRGYETARRDVTAGARAVEHGAHVVADHVQHTYDTAREAAGKGTHAVEQAAREAAERARGALDTLGHPGSWFDSKPQPAPSKPVRLDDPAHPGHAMYQQSRSAVHQIDAAHRRAPDQRSDNLAGALTVKAHGEGMTRVDQVALSEDGAMAFAFQNGAQTQTAQVHTADAVQTSLAQSSVAWQQVALRANPLIPPQQASSPALPSQHHELS